MLVLSRKKNEAIRIGRDIWVRVLEIQRGKVRIGIEAPEYVPVYRTELCDDETTQSAPVQRGAVADSGGHPGDFHC
jgi:carbon storage regulator